jgi:hypothetical protein
MKNWKLAIDSVMCICVDGRGFAGLSESGVATQHGLYVGSGLRVSRASHGRLVATGM